MRSRCNPHTASKPIAAHVEWLTGCTGCPPPLVPRRIDVVLMRLLNDQPCRYDIAQLRRMGGLIGFEIRPTQALH